MSGLDRLGRNFAYTIGGQVVEAGLGLAVVALVARYLQPDRFGTYALVLSFAQMFYFITDIGLVRLMVREIARDRDQARRYLGAVLVSRVFMIGATAPALVGLVHLVGISPEAGGAAGVAAVWLVLRLLTSVYDGLFQAFERMEFGSGIQAMGMVLRLAGSVVMIVLDAGVAGIFWAMAAAQLVQLAAAVAAAEWWFVRPEFRRDVRLWRFFLIESLSIGAMSVFNTAFHEIDTLILASFRSPVEVGLYNGPYRIVRQLLLLPLLLMRAPFPVLARLARTSRPAFLTVSEQGFKLGLAVGLPLGVLLASLGEKIVVFVLGEAFRAGTFVLWFYSGLVVVMFPTMFAASLLIVIDRQRLVAVVFAGAITLNAVLDLLLIPPLGGVGACIATSVTALAMCVALVTLVLRFVGPVLRLRALVPAGLSAACLGLVLHAVPGLGLLPSLLLGGLLYLLLALLSRTVSHEDLRLLREAVKRT